MRSMTHMINRSMIDTKQTANNTVTDERQAWFTGLYEDVFPMVAKFVAKRGGSFDDAKDVFHDALVILYEKQAEGGLTDEIAVERYLVGIAKHVWLRKFREDHMKTGLDHMEMYVSLPEDYFEPSNNRLLKLLEITGRKCMELLQAFYYDKLAIGEISNVFGFSSPHSASVQKYKCIEKMREMVQTKSLGYEDLA